MSHVPKEGDTCAPQGTALWVWRGQVCPEIIQLPISAVLNALCTDCKTPCAKNPHTGHCFRGVGESLKLIVETDKVPLTVFIPCLKPAAGAFMHTGRSCCGLASLQPSSAPASVHLKSCRKCFGEKQTCLTLQPNWQGFSAGATAMLLHPHLAHVCCFWPLTPCRPPNPLICLAAPSLTHNMSLDGVGTAET